MKLLSMVGFVALVATSAQAQSPRQFDLGCQRHEVGNPRKLFDPERFKIDLDAKTWCTDECEEIFPLTVTEDDLVLERDDAAPESEWATQAIINRRTAVYKFNVLLRGEVRSRTEAQCEVLSYFGANSPRLF